MTFDQLGRVNVAWITSCREVGLQGQERIGREVIDPDNGVSYGYRMGTLEAIARQLSAGDSSLSDRFNLVSVIVDDTDAQFEREWGVAELWPRNLEVCVTNFEGRSQRYSLGDLMVRIPSLWTRIKERDQKATAKSEYEQIIVDHLREKDVDLLVSDSYTRIIGPTLLDAYGGRILNVHPAITQVGDPDRLPGITPTRDAFTRAVHGYVIIDDKHAVDLPEGEVIEVEYRGGRHSAVRVPQSSLTGVTVHQVTDRVDNGPVVVSVKYAFPHVDGLTEEQIRTWNYAEKNELVPQALLNYIQRPNVQAAIIAGRPQHQREVGRYIVQQPSERIAGVVLPS